MRQVEKYLLKIALLLGIFIMPFAASAEEVDMGEKVSKFLNDTGFAQLFAGNWLCLVMIVVACVLFYLAIVKKFEPLLLLPIAFGMLLTNLPGAGLFHPELFDGGHVHWEAFTNANNIGLLGLPLPRSKIRNLPMYYFYWCWSHDGFRSIIGES